MVQGRGLAVLLCSVITTIAAAKGLNLSPELQSSITDWLTAGFAFISGGAALWSKVKSHGS